ncbi:hypothetical protein KKC94_03885 [Patescibacteria group bacterium]|nr:hypothetical protein [Patescibacteria group bacterium]
MKKIFFLSLILTLAFSFVGCKKFSEDNFVDTGTTDEVTTDTSDVMSDAGTPDNPKEIEAEYQAAVDTFMTVLVSDSSAAYASTNALFKQYTSEEELAAFLTQFPILQGYESYEFYNSALNEEGEVELNGFIQSAELGKYEINFLLDKGADGTTWEVSGFDLYKVS